MSSRREKLLQKINPKLLQMTPKLTGDTGSFINLDTNENSLEDGAKQLMMRFFKNHDLSERKKRNQNEVEIVISSAKLNDSEEICDLVSEKLTVPLMKEVCVEKPGRKLQALKMELQEKMSAKWEEEYKKRVEESKVYTEKSNHKDGYEEEEEEFLSDDEKDENDEKDEEIIDESVTLKKDEGVNKEDCYIEYYKDNDSDGGDANDESEEDVDENMQKANDEHQSINDEIDKLELNKEETNASQEDEVDGCSLIPAYQPGGGLLYGGSELTQNEDSLPQNLLSPSLRLSMTQSPNPKSFTDSASKSEKFGVANDSQNMFKEKSNFFQNSQNANDSFDLNDAFEFCSGKFPDTQAKLESQESNKNVKDDNCEDEELKDFENDNDNGGVEGDSEKEDEKEEEDDNEEEDSEKEESDVQKDLPKTRKNIILLEDSESEDAFNDHNNQEKEEETETLGGKLLSDDEEPQEDSKTMKKKTRKGLHFSDDEDEDEETKAVEEDDDISENENEEENIEEDIDQRSINYDSEENEIINPKEYFEKEAELSGSEVWSGDEDEKGLDEYDIEEGDADHLDNDQVRSQLEKIHIRRVLDDDAREVRLIQEILFEDGDLHSEGKGRERKFKWKNLGAFDDKENQNTNEGEAGGNSSDEDCAAEEELRKIRHQKELFLMEKKNTKEICSDDEIVEEDFQMVKITSVKNSVRQSITTEMKKESFKYTVHSEIHKTLTVQNSRGSFLTRNEEFLSRLAKVAAAASDNVLGPKNSKNFVFAAKSPEKEEPVKSSTCKRQIDETENFPQKEKKIKLLTTEIDTGPSIVDLLV